MIVSIVGSDDAVHPTALIALADDFSPICAGCGCVLGEDGGVVWSTTHVGRLNTAITSSAQTSGVVEIYHCADCDPAKTRVTWLRAEADRLERGVYTLEDSPQWRVVQGL